ncbi:MAG: hypothetical protein ACP5GJ_03065 [Nanopusillaceae archaeon]|jgi:putative serine/threonine protein kinase
MKKIDEGWHSEIFLTDRNTIIKKFKENLRKNYEKEKYFLLFLKDYGFVPKIINYDDEKMEIEMEYINGMKFKDLDIKEKIKYIEKILDILFTLDKLKIEKEEMQRPFDHIIIKDNKIYLIDWERSRIKDNPSNLTQFIQYLIKDKIIPFNKEIIDLLKEYKKNYSDEIFNKLKEKIKGYSDNNI